MEWSLIDINGRRKYLNQGEVDRLLYCSSQSDHKTSLFCKMIILSGFRVSEVLSLTKSALDIEMDYVVVRCLKKRGKTVHRAVPLPHEFVLEMINYCKKAGLGNEDRIWGWSRMTAYRKITRLMDQAEISGAFASPKGLRHAFGVRALHSGIPLNMLQRWLGHADIKTTAIYANAMGPEERMLASKMWSNIESSSATIA
jgi:integrase/recombinase XerD